MIDGTSKKIEFGAAKTWYFGSPNLSDITEFDADGDDNVQFYAKFYTPYVNDYTLFGLSAGENSFEWLRLYYKNWSDGFCVTYVQKSTKGIDGATGEYILMPYSGFCNVYKAGGAHWDIFNNASRTITFYESPTGALLSVLQKIATPVY